MQYHPMVRRKIGTHFAEPVRMEKNLRVKPREYGIMPRLDTMRLQKYRPRNLLKVARIRTKSSTTLYMARPRKKAIMIFKARLFPS